VPGAIGTVVSKGLATLHELDTVYGTQDLYDMLEIIAVDAHNERIIRKLQGAK
jgi:hypothetical protein